ncbi:MAG: alginate export family protein [Candidatus Hydrogenedentes bacterium]|nr:alginate export family protein [Candidatus Hydrogenedentota bacterium]
MRRLIAAVALVLMPVSSFADLQNVDVGGQLRIRGRYWSNTFSEPGRETRIPDFFLPRRPIGPTGTNSRMAFDDDTNSRGIVEQSTKLRVSADFTDEVNAVIELVDIANWGEGDFRSNYITGVDSRANTSEDVEVLQAYIEMNEAWGAPLRLRIGRQQLTLFDGWLVGPVLGILELSFDAVRGTYTAGDFVVDGWWAKLAESGIDEQDGDVDFYALSLAYNGFEGHELGAYWLYLRDARSLNDTNFAAPIEWMEDVVGLDDYDPTNLHTIGIRAAGEFGPFDYSLNAAYQTGNADSAGQLFAPFLYGDTGAEYDSWAGDLEIGYQFDVAWQPRVFLGATYFGGEDERDLTFLEWANPFYRPEASVSFNRLFSSRTYYFLIDQDRNASNFHIFLLGVEAKPTDAIGIEANVMKLGNNEAFDHPASVSVGQFRIPLAPALSFWTEESGKDIGWMARLYFTYSYSEDLQFRLLLEHLFADGDLDEGNFMNSNGLEFYGGSDHDDSTYVHFETILKF